MAEKEVVKVTRLTRWQRIGVASLLVFGAIVLSGVAFILSGIYNIGASREHWSATNFIITILRDRSITVASGGIEVPELDDPDMYRLGAEHFRGGCTTCHGEPGRQNNPIYQNMSPAPPDLIGAFEDYSAKELFWIVKNGLKYTGMPAWPADGRPDEVWSMVSFLNLVHQRGGDAYPELETSPLSLDEALAGVGVRPLENCIRCHGGKDSSPVSQLVPELNGLAPPIWSAPQGIPRRDTRQRHYGADRL